MKHEEYQQLAKEKLTFAEENDYKCGKHVCIYDKGIKIECEDHANNETEKSS